MEFWRRGAARSARPSAAPQRQLGTWQRITGLHFPAWVPVAGIILVVFGILGGLFLLRTTAGAPRIGVDHWHARYTFTLCGERQPNAPTWESGVHTHADGIMHIHPFQTFEEGAGARMVKWFEYGGGKITDSSIRMPGFRANDEENTWENGEKCADGTEGELQIFVTPAETGVETRITDVDRYQPRDGDRIRIVFGPPEEEPILGEDRTIILEAQAKGDPIEITVTDDGTDGGTKFEPSRISVEAGEVVKLVVKNTGSISHGFRVEGADGEYETQDDFLATPSGEDPETTAGIIQPGQEAVAIIRLDSPGVEVEFRDDTLVDKTGTIVVGEATEVTVTPTPSVKEPVDLELDVLMKDTTFKTSEITVPAGKKFRINLTNNGPEFVHSMTISGEDGVFDTDDDLTSTPGAQRVGIPGELVGQIDTPGSYPFRCDFHPTEMTGTVIVE